MSGSGKATFDVRMRVSGYVVYRVRADSPEEAESKAWDRFEEGADPHLDNTECFEGVSVRLVESVTLEELLREPRED